MVLSFTCVDEPRVVVLGKRQFLGQIPPSYNINTSISEIGEGIKNKKIKGEGGGKRRGRSERCVVLYIILGYIRADAVNFYESGYTGNGFEDTVLTH